MLVGMVGYAQHGKNSAADILVRDYGFEAMAFADALRELAAQVNPYVIPDAGKPNRYNGLVQAVGYERAKQTVEVRRFLQELGVGVRDILGPDAWVRAWETKLAALEQGTNVVVTDVRFPNEADAIAANGGELWLVRRWTDARDLFDNGIGTDHPSEAHVATLGEWADHWLNAITLEQLETAVHAAIGGRL